MEDVRICPEHGFYRGETCEVCSYSGEVVIPKEKVERLGKFISGVLRHFPDKFGLEMDENGWVDFEKLLRVVGRRYRWANRWVVKALIYSDRKGRYELKGDRIRARYGHSVPVELNDMPEAEEDLLYYGTSEEESVRLLELGIKPVNQTFVHLSTTLEKSEEVARLRTDEPIILEVDAKRARDDGIRLIKVNEHIVLVKEVPPEYIIREIRL
ncbi:RNA 2'-phosphotransferase [Geoglobus sp.]